MNLAFETAFVRDHAFGVIAGVRLPSGRDPVREDVLARLHSGEAGFARTLHGYRMIQWVGSRLAWHAAAAKLGVEGGPLLNGDSREPLPPAGLAASITHKRDLAIALVAGAAAGWIGVDLEECSGTSENIGPRILRPEELLTVQALPEAEREAAVLLRFSLKEAAYKAIHPRLRRYVGYSEARVDVATNGAVTVTLLLEDGAQAPTLEATVDRLEGRILSAVRCPRA